MTGALLQTVSSGLVASVMLALTDVAIRGALNGIIAGLIIGAVVWPIMQFPDSMGRVIALALVFAIGMILFEMTRISRLTGSTFSSILGAFQDFSTSTAIGALIAQAAYRVLIAMLVAAIIGVGSMAPGKVIIGAIIGLFLGLLGGALLAVLLEQLGFTLPVLLFQVLVGLLAWGILASLGGR
jgi:hypothetical protein